MGGLVLPFLIDRLPKCPPPKGRAESILEFLAARGIPASDKVRERILGCTDLALLSRWIARAATAASAEEVVR